MPAILVINPNSTESMTRVIDEACEPLRISGGPTIDSATLKEGPPGIETQQHVDGLIAPLTAFVRKRESQYAAFVIACYSDPGLFSVREATRKHVLGIAEMADEKRTFGRMVEVGRRLRAEHGADVIVMGCAGMARHRKPLQDAIGAPVVEPTQAAVAMAIGRVRLSWEQA